MAVLITCVVSFVFQVSYSHAVAERIPRASQVSSQIRITAEHFLPIERQNAAYSVIFLSFSLSHFFNEKGGKKETRFINTATMPVDSRYMRRGLVRYV